MVGANADVITDFDKAGQGDDVIDLSGLAAAALTYKGTAAFTGINQVRINDIAGADLIVQINLSGTTAPEMEIRLSNTAIGLIAATDFLL